MAARKNQSGGLVDRLVSWLAVPRLITLPVLLVLGAAAGYFLWKYVDSVKILAWLSGLASPFCTMCATVIWAMRDKLEDAVDTDEMSADTFEKFDGLVESHRNRSTFVATAVALMSLLAAVPAISSQLLSFIWETSVIVACMAVAFSIYGYQLANYWDLQIRRFKSKQVLEAKRKTAQNAELEEERMLAVPSKQVADLGRGWSVGPTLNDPNKQ